jgi:hypothetical protein
VEAYALWLEFKNACFVVGGLVYYFVLLKWRLHRSAHLGNYECLKTKTVIVILQHRHLHYLHHDN